MKRSKTAFMAAMVFCAMVSAAANNVFAGSPFVTEDSGTQGKGNVEAEFTFEHQRADGGVKTTSLGNSFTLGIAPKIDLAIGYGYNFVNMPSGDDTRSMGDVAAQLKAVFREGTGWLPTLGVKGGVSLPVETGGQTTVLLTGIAQWEFEPFSVFANIGADIGTRLAGNDERTDVIRASLAGSWELREALAFVSEVIWEKQTKPSGNAALEWMIGTKWALNDTMTLSAGVRLGLTSDSPDYTILAGFTWNFRGEKTNASASGN